MEDNYSGHAHLRRIYSINFRPFLAEKAPRSLDYWQDWV